VYGHDDLVARDMVVLSRVTVAVGAAGTSKLLSNEAAVVFPAVSVAVTRTCMSATRH